MANWKALTLISISVGLVGLTLIIVLFTATGGYVPFDYGIVLDAGSSHTQITLYHWLADKYRSTGIVEQLEICTIEPGISSYNTSDIPNIGSDLLRCIQTVSQKIEKDRISNTPIYLGATAGMRLLNLTDPKSVQIIFNSIKKLFEVNTSFQIETIDIISGENEGLFAWVTNNYLVDKLMVENFASNSTIGALDMGGASAQIAYRTESKSKDFMKPGDINITLYGLNDTVHSTTNLCFGEHQVVLRYQKYLIMTRNPIRNEINNPCLPIGRKQTVSGLQFNDKICVKLKDKSKEIQFDRNYTFVGMSDANECSRIIREHILNKTKCEQNFELCFNVSESRPPESTQFYAVSSYYYNTAILNLSQPLTAEDYREKTRNFCDADNATIFEEWPNVVPKYVDSYCFNLNYIYTTIANIYRFEDKMWPNIKFSQKIGNTDLGWSLGFMINATNAIAAEKPTPPVVELFPFIVVTILCTLILFFSIYSALKWFRNNDYEILDH